MWKAIHFLIVTAVVMANAIWQWTPNRYLAGGLGIGVAFVVTVVMVLLVDTLRGITRWPAAPVRQMGNNQWLPSTAISLIIGKHRWRQAFAAVLMVVGRRGIAMDDDFFGTRD